MADFLAWKVDFESNKKLVAKFDQSSEYAVHSIRRYLDDKGCVWEAALTYTGRLVVRAGKIGTDGVSVGWEDWKTLHHIDVPKSGW